MGAEAGGRPDRELKGGSFYGSIQRRREQCGAIFTDLRHTCPRKLPAHSHQLPFFSLLLAGDYRECYRHQEADFRPFTLSFRPAGIPHQDEIGPRGMCMFGIEILPGWQQELANCSGHLNVAYDCVGGRLLWLAMKLYMETRDPPVAGDLHMESLVAELVATAARMPESKSNHAPLWLSRTLDKLKAECCERLTLEDLGKDAGVHPVYLSRTFRRFTGAGIGEYVHRLRIRAACEHMLQRELPLADIALATGFADQSHLTRVFRQITGTSPAAFRRLVAAEV